MSRYKFDLGCRWYVKGRKRHVIETTTAAGNLLAVLADEHPGCKWSDLYLLVEFDQEALAVCKKMIELGFRDVPVGKLNYF